MTPVREACVSRDPPCWEVPGWRERFGVTAGITGRRGPDGEFNLGLSTAAPVGEVTGRWRRLRSALPGFAGMVAAWQVHGTEIAWHEQTFGWRLLDEADGHGTDSRGVLLAVTVADCVPVYLVDTVRGRLALLHAGWRGIAADILGRGVDALRRRGSAPGDLVMHCGVGICGACYTVGPDVAAALGGPPDGGPVDLRGLLVQRAGTLGIARVSVSDLCSAHDRADFFSHRASGGLDGRMVAYLGRPAGDPPG